MNRNQNQQIYLDEPLVRACYNLWQDLLKKEKNIKAIEKRLKKKQKELDKALDTYNKWQWVIVALLVILIAVIVYDILYGDRKYYYYL